MKNLCLKCENENDQTCKYCSNCGYSISNSEIETN